jgi:hypothetical protein
MEAGNAFATAISFVSNAALLFARRFSIILGLNVFEEGSVGCQFLDIAST